MKINYIFIFLLISLFSFSAMEKASQHYSAEIAELDSELEFEAPKFDSATGNDYVLHLANVVAGRCGFRLSLFIGTDYQDFWSGDIFSNDSSLNPIYYPHGPPVLG